MVNGVLKLAYGMRMESVWHAYGTCTLTLFRVEAAT